MSRRDGEDLFPDLLLADPEGPEPPRPSERLRARVLASVVPATRFEGFVERLAAFFDLPAARMRELAGAIADPTAPVWTDDVVPGVRLLHFAGGARRAAAHCGIVHVAAGVRYPRHRHEGTEWTFVLAGVAEDEDDGRRLEPGDLEAQPAGSAHAYRSAGDEPLVFAVVLEGDIRFV